jgi:hypothetical protein
VAGVVRKPSAIRLAVAENFSRACRAERRFRCCIMAKSSHGAKRSMNYAIRPHSGTAGQDCVIIGGHSVTPAKLDFAGSI